MPEPQHRPRSRYVTAATPNEGRRLLAATVPEADWQAHVEGLLTTLGWHWIHVRDARGQAVTGFPDLFAVRGYRRLAAELKSSRGRPTPLQQAWLDALRLAGVETYVFRPTDLDRVIEVLQ